MIASERPITFTFDGESSEAKPGQTIAASLAAHGRFALRAGRDGAPRGMHCGMGTCFECLVHVNGETNVRACMREAIDGDTVSSGAFRAPPPGRSPTAGRGATGADPTLTPDVLVIGGGPAGLSAALSADRAGARVVLLDERPHLGGQYYKQPSAPGADRFTDVQQAEGHRLVEAVRRSGVEVHADAPVWGTFEGMTLAALVGGRSVRFAPRRIVLAAGAFERGVPVPGWTLPGYLTTGAVQTLLRSHRVVAGQRILISGNGPLNLQLAAELVSAGATVVALVETARPARAGNLPAALTALFTAPGLVRLAAGYRRTIAKADVETITGHVVAEVRSTDAGLRARVAPLDDNGEVPATDGRWFDADVVAASYGFSASNELARALGCEHHVDERETGLRPVRDGSFESTVGGVYIAGDGAGLGGAHAAIAEGTIAGDAAARSALGLATEPGAEARIAGHRRRLARHRRFQRALWRIYRAPDLTTRLCTDDTLVCRCEEVTLAEVRALAAQGCDMGSVKRRSRAGMGRCQGRYCGPILARLLADAGAVTPDEFSGWAPRAPFKPLTVGAIADAEDGDD